MKKFLLYSLCAIALVACKKEVKNEQPVAGGAPASFNVFSPETKTTLDGLSVKWATGDKIRVYAHNTSTDAYDNGTYTISTGMGTSAGVFTKDSGEELTGTYDTYYAVYPAGLTPTVNGTTIAFSKLNSSPYHLRNQNPPEGSFDPNLAIMTAKYEGGKLSFRHGVGFIKVTIPTAGITKVSISFQNDCLAERPTYSASSGAISAVNDKNSTVTSREGTFTQGSSYYFAAIPRSGYHIGTTTITFTGGATVSTSHFSGKDIEVGKVFDLGTPAVVPVITATDITGAAYAGVTTTHAISFANAVGWTPSILSYTGCVSAASLTSTAEIAATPSDNTINYTVSPYDALVGNTGTIVVRLSKAGEAPIDKTINVTQNTSAGPTPHTYVFYLNSSGAVVQTEDGVTGASYFTVSGSSVLQCASTGSKPYFGVDSYTIGTGTYTYAKKIDGSNNVSFTPRSGVSTSVRFYAASRNTNTTATMYLKEGSDNKVTASLTWTDNKADLYDSGNVNNLTAGTVYSFGKSGEVGLFYVVVTESAL